MTKKLRKVSRESDALAAFFDDAKARETTPSTDLIERVLADADRVSKTAQQERTRPGRPRSSLWDWIDQTVGRPGIAILTASALFGITIGFTGAETLNDTFLNDRDTDVTEFDFFGDAGFDFSLMEG